MNESHLPITNALYGTDHPSLKTRAEKPSKAVPFKSPIRDHLDAKTIRRLNALCDAADS